MSNINLYVDGSFNNHSPYAGWGWAVVDDKGKLIAHHCGRTEKPALSRQIDGELLATIQGVKWATKLVNYKSITIHYDYAGIEKWAIGEWKSKKPISAQYIKEITELNDKYHGDIYFVKVKAHDGDKWNDYVDKLAKSAI